MVARGATVTPERQYASGTTFTVSFANASLASSLTGVGSERTAPLPGNVTVAMAQAALNALHVVNDGTSNYPGIPAVTVSSPNSASYEIVYGDASVADVTAEHLITHSATRRLRARRPRLRSSTWSSTAWASSGSFTPRCWAPRWSPIS